MRNRSQGAVFRRGDRGSGRLTFEAINDVPTPRFRVCSQHRYPIYLPFARKNTWLLETTEGRGSAMARPLACTQQSRDERVRESWRYGGGGGGGTQKNGVRQWTISALCTEWKMPHLLRKMTSLRQHASRFSAVAASAAGADGRNDTCS